MLVTSLSIRFNWTVFLLKCCIGQHGLGDDGGELTQLQKIYVFYRTPIAKYTGSCISFFVLILLYSYVALFSFRWNYQYAEVVLYLWILILILDELREVAFRVSFCWMDVYSRYLKHAFLCNRWWWRHPRPFVASWWTILTLSGTSSTCCSMASQPLQSCWGTLGQHSWYVLYIQVPSSMLKALCMKSLTMIKMLLKGLTDHVCV